MSTIPEARCNHISFGGIPRIGEALLRAASVVLCTCWCGHGIGRHNRIPAQLVGTEPVAPDQFALRLCNLVHPCCVTHQDITEEPAADDGRIVQHGSGNASLPWRCVGGRSPRRRGPIRNGWNIQFVRIELSPCVVLLANLQRCLGQRCTRCERIVVGRALGGGRSRRFRRRRRTRWSSGRHGGIRHQHRSRSSIGTKDTGRGRIRRFCCRHRCRGDTGGRQDIWRRHHTGWVDSLHDGIAVLGG